jgi:hypothetical protein
VVRAVPDWQIACLIPAHSPLLSGWLLQVPLQVEGSTGIRASCYAPVAKLAKLFMMNEIKISATVSHDLISRCYSVPYRQFQ